MNFEVEEMGKILHFKIPNETVWSITRVNDDVTPWRLYVKRGDKTLFVEDFTSLDEAYTEYHKRK